MMPSTAPMSGGTGNCAAASNASAAAMARSFISLSCKQIRRRATRRRRFLHVHNAPVDSTLDRAMHCDLALSQRLERTEATANARFVEARARAFPGSGAGWIEVGGTYAMFDGPRSPITQTFGLGLFQLPTADELDRIEAFFADRGAPTTHEVSPLAHKEMLTMLGDRGYRPVELTSVMFQPLGPRDAPSGPIRVRCVAEAEREM